MAVEVEKPEAAGRAVPEPSLRRMPLYHRMLKQLMDGQRTQVTCTEIGLQLGLDPTQIRKDLEYTGIAGRPKVGYPLGALIAAIENFLGWNNVNDAFLVGAGNLGAALLGYPHFADYGLNIVAAFDRDEAKVGLAIHGKEVFPLSRLVGLAQRMHILIGIITVPEPAAQEVADLMAAGGILAIWNFAPAHLKVPPQVIVHNENLYCSLASLSQKLAKSLAAKASDGNAEIRNQRSE